MRKDNYLPASVLVTKQSVHEETIPRNRLKSCYAGELKTLCYVFRDSQNDIILKMEKRGNLYWR